MKRRHCIFLLAGCIRNEPRRGAVCYWQLLNPPRTRSSDSHLRAMVMHRMFHAAGSVRADGRGSGPGSGLARTKHSIQKTIQFNSNVMGPRRGRGRTALSTPTTPPVQRSINSCTTATNDKRRGRLIYFIRSHHLPAISCPPWTPLIYFEWTNISDAHPFPPSFSRRPRPPLPSRGRHRPSSRCTRSRMGSRYVTPFREAGRGRRPWLEVGGLRFSRAGGRSAHQPTFEGPGEALSIQISESQALCGKINFIRTRRRT